MFLKKLASLCAVMGLFGCMEKANTVSPTSNEGGSISFRISMAPNSPFKKIAKSALLDITAPDMDTITKPLQINDSTIEGKVDHIPAGANRKFFVRVYDSAGTERYCGSAIGNISGDSTTLIALPISRIVGSAIINGTIIEGGDTPSNPFIDDSSTVFLANFNDNLTDFVSGLNGTVTGGAFTSAVFGKSLQFDSTLYPRAGFRFPNSTKISVASGSMEALVNVNGTSPGFMHIIDKSWLYGLTIFNGKVAVVFGKTWWYSNCTVPLQKWTYLAATFDGNAIKLYMNGDLVDTSPSTYIPTVGDVSWGLGIGNAFDTNFNIPFIGKIDEIRVSSKPRTDLEINANWSAIEANIPK